MYLVLTSMGVAGLWSDYMQIGDEKSASAYAEARKRVFERRGFPGIDLRHLLNDCKKRMNFDDSKIQEVRQHFDELKSLKASFWQKRYTQPRKCFKRKVEHLQSEDVDIMMNCHDQQWQINHLQAVFKWFHKHRLAIYHKLRLYELLAGSAQWGPIISSRFDIPNLRIRLNKLDFLHRTNIARCINYSPFAPFLGGRGVELIFCDEDFDLDSAQMKNYSPELKSAKSSFKMPGHAELMMTMAKYQRRLRGAPTFRLVQCGFAPEAQLGAVNIHYFEDIPFRSRTDPLMPRVINLSLVRVILMEELVSLGAGKYYIDAKSSALRLDLFGEALGQKDNLPNAPDRLLSRDQIEKVYTYDETKLFKLRRALKNRLDPKTIYVKAAGNEARILKDSDEIPQDIAYFRAPCVRRQTLIVGCYDLYAKKLASYSNRAGEMRDRYILAPGHWNLMERNDGVFVAYPSGGGTSLATAIVSALLADLYSHFPELDADIITMAALETANKSFPGYTSILHGQGLFDYGAAFQWLIHYRCLFFPAHLSVTQSSS